MALPDSEGGCSLRSPLPSAHMFMFITGDFHIQIVSDLSALQQNRSQAVTSL